MGVSFCLSSGDVCCRGVCCEGVYHVGGCLLWGVWRGEVSGVVQPRIGIDPGGHSPRWALVPVPGLVVGLEGLTAIR